MRTRIKMCGMTAEADIARAAALGVDAVGLVFHPRSPRCLEFPRAAELLAARPPFVTVVALFMDAARDVVQKAVDDLGVDCLQFHGEETPAFCASFGLPYIKALPMGGGGDCAGAAAEFAPSADALLFDAHRPGESGGQGRTFDWSRLPDTAGAPLILAGGLTPANVGDALRRVRPFAVDLCSGVERAAGVKDHDAMRRFVEAVRAADDALARRGD